MGETLVQLGFIVLLVMAASVVVALAGLALLFRSIRNIRVPPDADFFTTMHFVPLILVVLLDLLDLGLDVFAAPISWIALDRMGLRGLRNKAAIEALIPFTGPIPTFTIAWILARLLNLGEPLRQPYARSRPARSSLQSPPLETPVQRRSPQIIDVDPYDREWE